MTSSARVAVASPMVAGAGKAIVKARIWAHIGRLALRAYRNPAAAAAALAALGRARRALRGDFVTRKYVRAGGRHFWDLNCPGWPSAAFDLFIRSELNRVAPFPGGPAGLQTLMLAVTRKCPLRCEHCSEWDALDGRERLSLADLQAVLARFQERGVAQVQISGGEPMRRLDDVLALLRGARPETAFWLLTSGVGLDALRAAALRAAGLTGVQISLDHWDASAHDVFRGYPGAFSAAEQAAVAARAADLVLCLNLTARRDFVTGENLDRYLSLATRWGAGFVQILEPRAVGHWAGRQVDLSAEQDALLDRFYEHVNFGNGRAGSPAVSWHAYGQRRAGCLSAGDRFLFVDTDGDANPCPFCPGKSGSCLDRPVDDILGAVRARGCGKYDVATPPARLRVVGEAAGG